MKKITEELLNKMLNIIASSHTSLTYIQINELIKEVSELESITEEEKEKK